MGLEVICPRCGGTMRAWSEDVYGRMCMKCKREGAAPSAKQREAFDRILTEKLKPKH